VSRVLERPQWRVLAVNGRSPEELHRGSGGGVDPTEGQVACSPNHGAGVVGGEDGPAGVLGSDEVELIFVVHSDERSFDPVVFSDQW